MPRPRCSALWVLVVILLVAASLPAMSQDDAVALPPVGVAAADSRVLAAIRNRVRTVLMCAVLEAGALAGVPMRPDQIAELMQACNQPKLAHVNPSENDTGDDPPDPERDA